MLIVAHLADLAEPVLAARPPPVSPAHKRIRALQVLHMHVIAYGSQWHIVRYIDGADRG